MGISMPDARCLRAQAQHYLDLANQNSQGWEASTLKRMAAECLSSAKTIENRKSQKRQDGGKSPVAAALPATGPTSMHRRIS